MSQAVRTLEEAGAYLRGLIDVERRPVEFLRIGSLKPHYNALQTVSLTT